MAELVDIYRLRYWESTENLKEYLSEIYHKKISTRLATEIANYLRQGRLFFESASNSPPEIKPTLLFNGMVGFANAVVMAGKLCYEENLPKGHGLKDVSPHNAKLIDLTLKVEGNGTFQLFNDSTKIKKVRLLEDSLWKYYYCDSSPSKDLNQIKITLKDILARIPNLELSYRDTFGLDPKTVSCSSPGTSPFQRYIDFAIYHLKPFSTLQDIEKIKNDLESKYPFLKNWSLIEARWSYNSFNFSFANIKLEGEDKILKKYLEKTSAGFSANQKALEEKTINFGEIIPPIIDPPYLIEEFDGMDISKISLYYMGMFLLSSLVRYRSNTWTHSLSGRYNDARPIDDRALAIIMSFLDLSLQNFPGMILDFIKEPICKSLSEDKN